MALIRRAKPEDARGIHDTHMRSIREICSRDHSPEEIAAWSGRPYVEEQRLNAMKNNLVWVVAEGNVIQGYALLAIHENSGDPVGHIGGLYLVPEANGQGFGSKLATLMLEEARSQGLKRVTLSSTLTAHNFYKHMGFRDSGSHAPIEISGISIRSIPMDLELA